MSTRKNNLTYLQYISLFVTTFIAIFFVSGVITTEAYNLTPDVSYSITETGGYDGNLTMQEQESRIIHYVVDITNHGPGSVNVEKAAFHHPIANWTATDEFLDQSLIVMTGKTHYEEGESGQVEFFYDTTQKNCGRVQIDGGFRDPQDGNFVFIGTMINYGVDCNELPPESPTVTITADPVDVEYNGSSSLNWVSTNATS